MGLLAAACGGNGHDARDALSQTAKNLGRVRSADLHLRVGIRPEARSSGVAVSLYGPFALPAAGRLPTARIAYSRSAGSARVSGTLISTPQAAYVRTAGTTFRLSDRTAAPLRSGTTARAPFASLHVDRWIRSPRIEDAGDGLERVSGRLDLAAAVRDLRRAGGGAALPAGEAGRVGGAVRSSSIHVLTTRGGRMLRRLTGVAVLDAPAAVRRRVRGISVRVSFELALARVNQPVSVAAPPGARSLPVR
jgi:hypothetical protein